MKSSNTFSTVPAIRRFLTLAVILLAGFGLAATASAGDVTDEEVELFAAASIAVEDVTDRYEAQLEDAPKAEQQELVAEMSEKMQQAVLDAGLSWERYQDIVFEAGSDEVLNERIIQEIESQRD